MRQVPVIVAYTMDDEGEIELLGVFYTITSAKKECTRILRDIVDNMSGLNEEEKKEIEEWFPIWPDMGENEADLWPKAVPFEAGELVLERSVLIIEEE